MKASEMKEKSVAELKVQAHGLLERQFKLRMAHGGGELTRTHQLREVRRDLARIRTVIQQKENNGEAS